jgi:Fur family ferric uptake transcriptional regulator
VIENEKNQSNIRPMERDTRQRRAIRKVLEESGRPLSHQEILDSAISSGQSLGVATVYRNIRIMLSEGEIVAVQLPGLPDRYELSGKSHHHHFQCLRCNRVYEIEGCPGDMKKLVPKGFRMERHELTLYGVCIACA